MIPNGQLVPSRGVELVGPSVERQARCLSTLSSETTGELHVLGLDGDTLGVDGTQVGVYMKRKDESARWIVKRSEMRLRTLEERDEVSLGRLLKSHDGGGLEPQVSLEVLGDFCGIEEER